MRTFSTFLVLSLTAGLGGCVLSVGDGDDETTTTTTSATTTETGTSATTETGSEGEAEATSGDGDGDGDASTSTTETSTSGDGDGDGDCELYSDPAMGGCCEGEQPLGIADIDGAFCAPLCDEAMMCPASSAGNPQCALMDPMGGDPSCAVICAFPGDSSDCPGTATCKDSGQMGIGICTYG